MKELALKYYNDGFGCGQCIIKAADEKYSLGLTDELVKSLSAAGNGFGYGGLCAAAAAVILLFGYMFEENKAKRLRLSFLEEFRRKYCSFNCCSIAGDCEKLIAFAAGTADRLISKELQSC